MGLATTSLTGEEMEIRYQTFTVSYYLSDLTTEHRQPEAGEKARKEGLREKVDPNYAKPKN